MKDSRRNFLKKTMLMGMGSMLLPEIAKAAVQTTPAATTTKLKIKKDSVILFQGDSITDAGREKGDNICNTMQQFGNGYVLFTGSQLLERCANQQVKIYNRGVGGNKVYQLRERWEMECLAFQPDVLSILIGVNDYWHTLGGNYNGTLEIYRNDYRALLRYTKEKLPNVQLVLCEPFILKDGSAIDDVKWYPMFDEYRKVVRELATEFKAIFVPFQAVFDEAIKRAPDRYWSNDGVHPDLPGRQLMANAWMEATGLK